MKFHEIPIGTRFEFSGEAYTKTSPVIATREIDGKQKFMARSASVNLIDAQDRTPSGASPKRTVELERVIAAFDAFYLRCKAEAEKLARSEEELELLRHQMDHAQRTFLSSL